MSINFTALRPSGPDQSNSASANTYASLIESTDAASSTATTYSMGLGDTFSGGYGTLTDTDWVRVQLVAGQAYTFTLTSPVADTYLYLHNAAGAVIAQDDDSAGNLNSRLTFTATTTGTYYLEASQWSDWANITSYALTMSSPTVWTPNQMADQLVNGYWESDGDLARDFNVAAGGTITVNLSAISAQMQTLALRALQAWTDTTGLRFTQMTGAAQIEFRDDAGDFGPDAYSDSVTDVAGNILSSFVNIDQDWLDSSGTGFNSYTYQTYIHEIGHAIGLGHAGNYNGSATYGADNNAINDSWQLTVMSYFDQEENTYINDTRAYIITPMLADIIAMQTMYGLTNQRVGDTTYGENSNAGTVYSMFSQFNTDSDPGNSVAMTVIDGGGIDTFDFHSDTRNQRIDLRAETVSDVYGDLGTLTIARGTVIERLLAGSGNDTLTGNDAANTISGNGGNDVITGNAGNDTLNGGDGGDTLNGGVGNDHLFGGSTNADIRDVIYGGDGNDNIDGGAGNDDLNGGNDNDTVIGGLGSDTVIGNDGNDVLGGSGGSDIMFGNAGNDVLNGGFGYDRLNGGAGADSFFHAGVFDHASDWVQDYNAAEGDVLTCGLAGATRAQFQVNFNTTPGAGAAGVGEAFVIYRPTGQILWALVDGADDAVINLQIGGQVYDLV
ncbi:MAG: M10 family metallopeptidase C-terminal domain-containing protein [Paracoccaceae bacterium]